MLCCQEKTPPRRKEVASSSEWSDESDEMKPEKSTLILTKSPVVISKSCFVCLFKRSVYCRERERAWVAGTENLTQTLYWAWSPVQSSVSWPWDYDMSQNQLSDAQPPVPPRCPSKSCFGGVVADGKGVSQRSRNRLYRCGQAAWLGGGGERSSEGLGLFCSWMVDLNMIQWNIQGDMLYP